MAAKPRPAAGRLAVETRVLLLAPTTRDADAAQGFFAAGGIPSVRCGGLQELARQVGLGAGVVMVSEEALAAPDGSLAAALAGQPVWSDLPVVVLSAGGDESAVVTRAFASLGNVSVVERPVRVSTLLSVVRAALRARERQYQVRDQFAAQERDRAALARDALLLAHVRDSVIVTDLAGTITFWNEGATRLFGFTADEMLGRPYVGRLPEASRAEVEAWIARIAASEGEFAGEWLDYRKDGSPVWIEATTRRIADADGRPVGIMGVAHDISERKEAEQERERLLAGERAAREEAERASRMKDEFLATLSHELRTPLNAIVGWSQILRRVTPSEDDLKEGLATIERNAQAQARIVEDLLDMSRIISGRIRLDVRPVDLAGVVRAAAETVRPAAEGKGVDLQLALDPSAGIIAGDDDRLQQVFWNLLSNAVKFTPRGGQVRAILERHAGGLKVSVRDTGEGIDAGFLPNVFDRFRQQDAGSTRRHGGLGLGLAIVKQLVELHGGSVSVESGGPGTGATFTVTLPLTITRPEPNAASENGPRPAATQVSDDLRQKLDGVRVLVVDDEPDARAVVKRLLDNCEAIVTTAGSAAEAFERIQAERPHVLVSDVGMPGEDGYALIRRVRSLPPAQGGRTPAIALTAYARDEDRKSALTAGFQMHAVKPVNPAELIAMIATLAGRERSEPDFAVASEG